MSKDTVGVVLVNWNGAQHTIPCIESILAGSVKPDWIVVVDNASRDDSASRIVERFPEVTLVRNTENLGFTGANNIGIRRLMDLDCDYVWILNNDTTVDRECLAVMKDHLATRPEVSACSGKILYADPPNLIWYAGATFNPWTVQVKHRGQGEIDAGQFDQISGTPFLSGCCMFLRREAIESVGEFDDRFFAYSEDSDWCLRALEDDRRLSYVPWAVVRHKVSATVNSVKAKRTAGSTSPFSVYITHRNRVFLIRKHASGWIRLGSALGAHAAWVIYYALALALLGRWEKLRALIVSVYDGVGTSIDGAAVPGQKPRYLG